MADYKRKIKDSVFTVLFRCPENQLALYRDLHPEDSDISEADIKLITLEHILTDGFYNDLGLQVGDKMILLAEAQSTYSPNIPLRMLLYMADTYKNYVEDQKINVYSSKPQSVPRPELYVIYTGKRKSVPAVFLLSELYGGAGDIEVCVRVLRRTGQEGILNQYIRFCEIADMQRTLYGMTQEAIQGTIRICLEEHVLTSFLMAQKKEVVDLMQELFTQEKVMEFWGHELREEGRAEGLAEGRAEGLAEGREEGLAEGLVKGKEAGLMQGVLTSIQSLMESMDLTPFQAMTALKIPEADYQKYLNLLTT